MAFDINTGVGQVADLVTTVINKIWPDKSEQEKQELAAALTVVQGQLEINKVEAGHASIFVAGWRPASGWICNIGLLYTFLLQPLLTWLCTVAGVAQPPGIPFDALYVLLGSLLGVGTLRTVDKVKGVASS